MGQEIERKFLVTLAEGASLYHLGHGADSKRRIMQYYIMFLPEKGYTERVRAETYDGGVSVYTHTIKRGAGIVREENEREISKEEFHDYLAKGTVGEIVKTRYLYGRWEIDLFYTTDQIIVAEIELEDVDETPPPLPEILTIVKEVTEDKRWTNVELAIKGFPEV